MIEDFVLSEFHVGNIVGGLSRFGVVSVRFLREDFRRCLLREARSYAFRPEPEIVGSGDKIVRQQMCSFDAFPGNSRFFELRTAFENLLNDSFKDFKPYPFVGRLFLNTMSLQRYDKGSIGITPHRDGFRYKNLICNFNIDGTGKFFVCPYRTGKDSCEIPFPPGNVLLMRAPGFFGRDDRPFHYVKDIRETRYIFSLRQRLLSKN